MRTYTMQNRATGEVRRVNALSEHNARIILKDYTGLKFQLLTITK